MGTLPNIGLPRDPGKLESVVGELEHARHVLDRVAMFARLAREAEGPDEDEHRLALVEVTEATLTEALRILDGALRAIGARWRRNQSRTLARSQKRP